MALVPLTRPYALNSADLTIAEDDFSDHINQVTFTPSTPSATTFRSINGKTRKPPAQAADWTVTIGGAQDLAPTGLLRYLLDNEGETKDAVFTPTEGGPSILATLQIAPAQIGGSTDGALTTFTVTLSVDGKPVFQDA